jgi:hypothetical protein
MYLVSTLKRKSRLVAHLLAQEIADFQRRTTVLDDAVDREMSVHSPHFVSEALKSIIRLE